MYKLIFVDDEAIVRDGISTCIPWGQNGFELAGLFEHGLAALDYMKAHPVDVVISDINMPRMDGLSLSRVIEEQYPDVMVLLLSGYDDFEYAQEALKTKVREFLLKPITAYELSDVLLRIEEELNFIKDRKNQYELMQEKLTESFPLLKNRFFYRLVSGKLELEKLSKRKEYFQWQDKGGFYQISIISVPEDWDEFDRIVLSEYVKTSLKPGEEIFANRAEDFVILFQGEDKELLKQRSRLLAEKIYLYASGIGKEQISTGCGEVIDNLALLPESYRGADNAVNYSRVLGMSQILSIEDVRDRERISPEKFSEMTTDLSGQLKSGDRSSSKKSLDDIFMYLEERILTPMEASFYFTRIHLVFLNFLQEMDMFSNSDGTALYEPQNLESINRARVFLTNLLEKIEDRIKAQRSDAVRSRIEKAKEIIENRMGDTKFSLQEICNNVYLSVSQFSLIFKEGTGKTFIEYLTYRRVEQAKIFLKTSDLKVYEIAEKTGFADPRYFSIIFKKTTGNTPLEYRRSLGI